MALPNIVLIHSDQHRYDMIGSNGNRVVRTPNLDRLAAGGASFEHAFSTCPICTPARASLMTGAWPTTHRSLCIPTSDFWQPARRELPVLTELIANAGYYVGMVGKYHQELEGGPTDHGVADYVPNGAYRSWCAEHGLPAPDRRMGLFGAVMDDRPPEASPVAFQADRVLDMLDAASADAASAGSAPFFIRWDPPEPHLPCHPPKRFLDMYDGRQIPPWPSFPDPLDGKPDPQRRQHTLWGTGGWGWERWEPFVRLYYAQVTELDHHIGRVMDRLDANGLSDDTLVIYSTDHGDFCGGHGLMDKHFSMYDDILRVPLVVRWPGRIAAGSRPDGFVSQEIDIARTILEAAGIAAPESFVGTDLVAHAAGAVARRDDIFSQYFGTETGMYSSRMVRDRSWKYVWNPLHGDELYRVETDPGELVNFVEDPAYADQVARLRRRLVDWMETVGDRLLNVWTKVELLGEPNAWQRAVEGR